MRWTVYLVHQFGQVALGDLGHLGILQDLEDQENQLHLQGQGNLVVLGYRMVQELQSSLVVRVDLDFQGTLLLLLGLVDQSNL